MSYKGHYDLLKDGSKHNTIKIKSTDSSGEMIVKEYFFENGKISKIIDFINWTISEYKYIDDATFEVTFYQFQTDESDKMIDSIKVIQHNNGIELEEKLFEIDGDGNKELVYTGTKEYAGDDLLSEVYKYPDFDYIIAHNWDGVEETVTYPEEGVIKYIYDTNGFLLEYQNLQTEGMCQQILYSYENGKLSEMTDNAPRPFGKGLLGGIPKFKAEAQYAYITSFKYNEEGDLIKEEKKDKDSGNLISTTEYIYE